MLAGLDRYQSLTWQIVPSAAGDRLDVRAQPKRYGPPFVFLGREPREHHLQRCELQRRGAAYCRMTSAGSGSEFRFDVAVGSQPSIGMALVSAARQHAVLRRAVRRRRQAHAQLHPGRPHRRLVRADAQHCRLRFRRQHRPARRRAPAHAHRSARCRLCRSVTLGYRIWAALKQSSR